MTSTSNARDAIVEPEPVVAVARQAGIDRVDSPMMPPELAIARDRLQARVDGWDKMGFLPLDDPPRRALAVWGSATALLVLLGFTVDVRWWALAVLSGGLGMYALLTVVMQVTIRGVQRRLDQINTEHTFPVPTTGQARDVVERVLADFAALPAHLRAECVPMLETVRVAGEALIGCPEEERLLRMLRDRADLVSAVRREWESLQTDLQVSHARGPFGDDDADMEAARLVVQALAAVRAEQQALSHHG